jgi:PKD repeat protein
MQKKIVSRWISIGVTFVITALAAAPAALAAIPDNDNFANATIISALPFNDSGDLPFSGMEPGEPTFCGVQTQTVWYKWTAPASRAIKVSLSSTDPNVGVVFYQASGGGLPGLTFNGCTNVSGPFQLNVSAGTTYYFQVGNGFFVEPAHIQLAVEEIPRPVNDDFAGAAPIQVLPFVQTVDLANATVESGEPVRPSHSFDTIVASVWYAFSSNVSQSLMLTINGFCCISPIIAVYTGQSLTTLTEVVSTAGPGQRITFRANAGTTYYIQFGRGSSGSGPMAMTLQVEVAPPPQAGFFFSPTDPSIYDTVQFFNTSFDPAFVGIQTAAWDFGDGTTATGSAAHRYAADGDYSVTLTVTTFDGRTGSITQTIHVRTHDVAITKFAAPNAASAGQTRHLTVGVSNNLSTELVQVMLYKSAPGTFDGFQIVGTLTQQVGSISSGNRVTPYDFSYTFTDDDAVIGKVTFKAVATMPNVRDAQPADNTAIAPPTKVNP